MAEYFQTLISSFDVRDCIRVRGEQRNTLIRFQDLLSSYFSFFIVAFIILIYSSTDCYVIGNYNKQLTFYFSNFFCCFALCYFHLNFSNVTRKWKETKRKNIVPFSVLSFFFFLFALGIISKYCDFNLFSLLLLLCCCCLVSSNAFCYFFIFIHESSSCKMKDYEQFNFNGKRKLLFFLFFVFFFVTWFRCALVIKLSKKLMFSYLPIQFVYWIWVL